MAEAALSRRAKLLIVLALALSWAGGHFTTKSRYLYLLEVKGQSVRNSLDDAAWVQCGFLKS